MEWGGRGETVWSLCTAAIPYILLSLIPLVTNAVLYDQSDSSFDELLWDESYIVYTELVLGYSIVNFAQISGITQVQQVMLKKQFIVYVYILSLSQCVRLCTFPWFQLFPPPFFTAAVWLLYSLGLQSQLSPTKLLAHPGTHVVLKKLN